MMDYHTKWPEAYPIRNSTTETVVECLIDLTARMGVPSEILTDNGANFVSKHEEVLPNHGHQAYQNLPIPSGDGWYGGEV